jgi:hypothetical protein
LRSRFEALQIANTEWADATEGAARNMADQIKAEFSSNRKVLMGLALAPLLVGVLICLAVLVLFIWLLLRLPDNPDKSTEVY